MSDDLKDRIIRQLVFDRLMVHKLPWRVEEDWTLEVTAANGAIIVKCQKWDEAIEIIRIAEQIEKDLRTPIPGLEELYDDKG